MFAGFPWFGSCSRDTFLSLPGLTLANGDEKTFKQLLSYLIDRMKGPFFPHKYYQNDLYYTALDSPLWFIYNIQKYETMLKKNKKTLWKEYGNVITKILNSFIEGTDFNVKVCENGLLYGGNERLALTWMNVFCDGKPLTPRTGFAVEINALWYNALRYAVSLLQKWTQIMRIYNVGVMLLIRCWHRLLHVFMIRLTILSLTMSTKMNVMPW